MRGLSLTQPWATLVAIGAKTFETRSWPTDYRGELLIHASKNFPKDCQALCWRSPFAEALIAAGYDRVEQLPLGVILAASTLDVVIPTEDVDRLWQALARQKGHAAVVREQAFGDYSPRRYVFVQGDVKRLPTPLPACHRGKDGTTKPGGSLGLWNVPQVLLDLVAGQGVL